MRDQIRIIEPWRALPGAQPINSVVRDALPWLLDHANVIRQSGPDNVEGLRRHPAQLPAQCAARCHSPRTSAAELPDVLALPMWCSPAAALGPSPS
ncbi:hypothetical protein [Streptomyces sp900116325]|uniref:hypothetical protein n=1 Tax=Streptomyces sp. 900116325 TaxID=3154295 RepID=UPI003326BFCB